MGFSIRLSLVLLLVIIMLEAVRLGYGRTALSIGLPAAVAVLSFVLMTRWLHTRYVAPPTVVPVAAKPSPEWPAATVVLLGMARQIVQHTAELLLALPDQERILTLKRLAEANQPLWHMVRAEMALQRADAHDHLFVPRQLEPEREPAISIKKEERMTQFDDSFPHHLTLEEAKARLRETGEVLVRQHSKHVVTTTLSPDGFFDHVIGKDFDVNVSVDATKVYVLGTLDWMSALDKDGVLEILRDAFTGKSAPP